MIEAMIKAMIKAMIEIWESSNVSEPCGKTSLALAA